MAKIYDPPAEIGPVPEFDWKLDYKEIQRREQEWTDRLAAWCRSRKQGACVGEVIRDHVADGYARYMVAGLRPLELIHLPLGDAWHSRWAHLWTAKEVKQMVEREHGIRELFGRGT